MDEQEEWMGSFCLSTFTVAIPQTQLHFINIIISMFYKSKEVIIIIRKSLEGKLKRNLPARCRTMNCYLGNISQKQVGRKFLSTFTNFTSMYCVLHIIDVVGHFIVYIKIEVVHGGNTSV